MPSTYDSPLPGPSNGASTSQDSLDGSSGNFSGPNPPTVAQFVPASTSPASRSRYQVTQKSPLLVATPPQITRALSQSYPYVRMGNKLMGLLTWTSGDPWESFLLVAVFWAVALYGGVVLRWGGNVVVVVGMALGMFLRRYREEATHPSLDEILDTLTSFTARVTIFLEPFHSLTTFLSTTRTPTSATTGPALTALAFRMLAVTPLWLFLTIWPFHIITTKRIVLVAGTAILSWHSRPAKVTRTILWRSLTIRWLCEQLTGLDLSGPALIPAPPPLPPRKSGGATPAATPNASTTSLALPQTTTKSSLGATSTGRGTSLTGPSSPGVRFTFVIYENQRRWLGIGWNTSLFAYERAPWTDESLEPCPPLEEFTLPETPRGAGSSGGGWTRNGGLMGRMMMGKAWNNGTREGADSWGKYTRRRKWIRNAELVEDDGGDDLLEADGASGSLPPPPYEATGGGAGREHRWGGTGGECSAGDQGD
ncbi:integral peroxisomal membrane peroxin-domain-containing protein [Kalaharituber pfeilii]|nr:integral peroxisomal membrane peroxin-domain-containing protein [Kalaharituber pfeilii]